MKKALISPSILSADFSRLGEECLSLENSGADLIHCDVMDGVFVPNITFGMPVVRDIKKRVKLPLDVHLMIADPEKYICRFAESGADIITFHVEAACDPLRCARLIKNCGKKVGISVKPDTPVSVLEKYRGEFDLILIMSVEPGFGGQEFIQGSLEKISMCKKLFPDVEIEVDGGINADNAKDVIAAGVDIVVAGSAVFAAADKKEAIKKLRGL